MFEALMNLQYLDQTYSGIANCRVLNKIIHIIQKLIFQHLFIDLFGKVFLPTRQNKFQLLQQESIYLLHGCGDTILIPGVLWRGGSMNHI